jgi:hypothetical protein
MDRAVARSARARRKACRQELDLGGDRREDRSAVGGIDELERMAEMRIGRADGEIGETAAPFGVRVME